MSEAARKSYFHFSPSPRGRWSEVPPTASGHYWVRPAGSPDERTVVRFDAETGQAFAAGAELAEEELPLPPDRIATWWTERIPPPPKGSDGTR